MPCEFEVVNVISQWGLHFDSPNLQDSLNLALFCGIDEKYSMWKFIVDGVHDFGSSLWLDVGRGFLHVSNVLLLLLMKIYCRAFIFRLHPWLHTLGSETSAWVSTQPGVPTNVMTSRSARVLQTVYTVEINSKLFLSPFWRPRLTTHANISMSGCSQRTNNVITASLIYQNDVATSFGINNDVVITLRSAESCFLCSWDEIMINEESLYGGQF